MISVECAKVSRCKNTLQIDLMNFIWIRFNPLCTPGHMYKLGLNEKNSWSVYYTNVFQMTYNCPLPFLSFLYINYLLLVAFGLERVFICNIIQKQECKVRWLYFIFNYRCIQRNINLIVWQKNITKLYVPNKIKETLYINEHCINLNVPKVINGESRNRIASLNWGPSLEIRSYIKRRETYVECIRIITLKQAREICTWNVVNLLRESDIVVVSIFVRCYIIMRNLFS